MKIEIGKKYKTKGGRPVEILAVKPEFGGYQVVGMIEGDEDFATWTLSGHFFTEPLFEVSPYDDFKIDDKVLVRECPEDAGLRRYFAGVAKDGRPRAWNGGATSWTAHGEDPTAWEYCEKVEE
jgi:hypothetical protein